VEIGATKEGTEMLFII